MNRIIQNDNPAHPVESLPPDFIASITEAQVKANAGWAPKNTGLIDRRVANCPSCGSPGMNSCWGYWAFTCGAEIGSDGDVTEPCGNSKSEASELLD